MTKKKKARTVLTSTSKLAPHQPSSDFYEGERLDDLLMKLRRTIESTRDLKVGRLPEKIWMKQQFAIGINDVTRVFERMPAREMGDHYATVSVEGPLRKAQLAPLQAVLLAADCNPRALTKHILSLASTRGVPVISIRDNRGGSIRLGELVNLKTAMAVGVKARESNINRTVDELLQSP